MRIIFQRTGGFIAQKLELNLDLKDLPADQAETLRLHLDEVNFLSLEEKDPASSYARDAFHYLIVVETDNIRHAVQTTDMSMPASLRSLITQLSELARMQRGK
jgi:hypothetical protein